MLESLPHRALLARAGLILGPNKDVGRLPSWLEQVSRGGRVPAPEPAERKLPYIDARDLVAWMLEAAARHVIGVFNTVNEPGHATMGKLLKVPPDGEMAGLRDAQQVIQSGITYSSISTDWHE